jgi:hypothetical protein
VVWIIQDKSKSFVWHEYEQPQKSLSEHAAAIKRVPWKADMYHGPTYAYQEAAASRNELEVAYGIPTASRVKDILCGNCILAEVVAGGAAVHFRHLQDVDRADAALQAAPSPGLGDKGGRSLARRFEMCLDFSGLRKSWKKEARRV